MATNMERFDLLTGAVFADLYESFPEPVILDPCDYLKQIAPEDQDIDSQRELRSQAVEFFSYTIDWLAQTGYLTHSAPIHKDFSIYEKCVLTAKGLEVLKALPDRLSGKTLGSQLQEATKAGIVDSVKSLTGKALGVGASMTYAAASSWINNQ